MARVNCYLPDELRDEAFEVDNLNFSEILRLGVVARLKIERERRKLGPGTARPIVTV